MIREIAKNVLLKKFAGRDKKMKTVANIFPIINAAALTAEYKVFKIVGLKEDENYFANQNTIVDRLSRRHNHPFLIIDGQKEPKLIVRNEQSVLSRLNEKIQLVRTSVYLEDTGNVIPLDFTKMDDNTKQICLRFLHFDIKRNIGRYRTLFLPETTSPFFSKDYELIDGAAFHPGFIFRPITLPHGGFGIVIDVTAKIIASKPVGVCINKDFFHRRIKGRRLLYKYEEPDRNLNWYEFKAWELDDLNVTSREIDHEPLIDLVRRKLPKPHPDYLAKLPANASVLAYMNGRGETRYAPAGMCFETYEFQEMHSKKIQEMITLAPHKRFYEIQKVRKDFFDKLRFGNHKLEIADEMLEIGKNQYYFPDFELGNNNVLSISDFYGNEEKSALRVVRERMNRLQDMNVGFYTSSPLPNCFFALPRSINDGKGSLLIDMLKENAGMMYPHDSYEPQVIPYEDSFSKRPDYIELAKHIVDTVKARFRNSTPAYGVVMIPRLEKTHKKDHDKLGATIIRELKKFDFTCSIIHTDTVNTCVEVQLNEEGKNVAILVDDHSKQRKWTGYVKNVLINKVLLTCNKWPFILKEPLVADITIGIDVIPKTQIAGFTLVDKHVKFIMTELDDTDSKEKLTSRQVESMIYYMIEKYCEGDEGLRIKDIVIHRDGRLLEPELKGIKDALERLKTKWFVHPDVSIHVVEIPKSSFYSIRMFNIKTDRYTGRTRIDNPSNGQHFFIGREAFLCTTGAEFNRFGTSNPLYVKYSFGSMNKENILSDFFKLTTMAYTKPDFCSRYPITLKLNDIRLAEQGSEYDEDAYRQVEKLFRELNINQNE